MRFLEHLQGPQRSDRPLPLALLGQFAEIITPEDFRAAGDGVTDDTAALTNFINAMMASPTRIGVMSAKTYAITAALPTINVSGVRLFGAGPSTSHDGGVGTGLSIIKWTGGAGGTMLTIAPTSGAGNQRLDGIRIEGVHFDANGAAAKGVVVQSVRGSIFDISVFNATSFGLELGVVATLAEARDIQSNRFRFVSRQLDGNGATGVALHLLGDASANVSFNVFENIAISHSNATAVLIENGDNNVWLNVIALKSGTATISIDYAPAAGSSVGDEIFLHLSCSVAVRARATNGGAQNVRILGLDKGNSSPDPVIDAGATLYWQNTNTPIAHGWTSWTPTFTSAGGTLGTTTINRARYIRYGLAVHFYIDVTITSAGTAPTGDIRFTLPVPANTVACAGTVSGHEAALNGNVIGGHIDGTNARGTFSFDNGATPSGNGNVLRFGGTYEAA